MPNIKKNRTKKTNEYDEDALLYEVIRINKAEYRLRKEISVMERIKSILPHFPPPNVDVKNDELVDEYLDKYEDCSHTLYENPGSDTKEQVIANTLSFALNDIRSSLSVGSNHDVDKELLLAIDELIIGIQWKANHKCHSCGTSTPCYAKPAPQ
jgi:hypothetical protein